MVESNNEFRAKFIRGITQENWISNLRTTVPVKDIAKVCFCSERTIRDWQREKFYMNYECLLRLCSTYGLPIPVVKKVHRFAHNISAGKKGGQRTVALYGGVKVDESIRKQSWQKWWDGEGKKKRRDFITSKKVTLPSKSKDLSEFMGLMLGDGTVSTYHISVTLHSVDDYEYSLFVQQLMKKLFSVCPKVYARKNSQAIAVTIARKRVVDYLNKLGLPIGDKIKKRASVPKWVLNDDRYMKACLRGLIDTDGTVFDHVYYVKGKEYTYTKISFSSGSHTLRNNVYDMLSHFGIKACVSGTNVRLDSRKSVDDYKTLIGFHNPKHLKRMFK